MTYLSHREESIMLVVWQKGKCTVKDVYLEMNFAQIYTTIASTFENLEKKKFVKNK
jgi:predicted transcriptional regulator